MTDAEILTQVKFALGITGDFQDDTISQYIAEVSAFMVSAGVPDDVVTSDAAVGCIARGVADLWNYGSGNTKLSSYFVQRVQQLASNGAYKPKDGFSPTITVLNLPNGYRLFITDVNGNKTVDIFHGQNGAAGQDGSDGAAGKDGFSPIVAIAEIEGGHRLTITDASGEKTVDIMDGQDSGGGGAGQDGFSPTIETSEITGGHRLTITDVNGTRSVDVLDGANGTNGRDGNDGNDGVSPTVTVTQISNGNRVTVTDKNGTQTFDVTNGQDGHDYVLTQQDKADIAGLVDVSGFIDAPQSANSGDFLRYRNGAWVAESLSNAESGVF